MNQIRNFPELQIEDIYKFVFQGVMGSGHAIQIESVALERFRRELCDLDQVSTAEEIIDLLSPEFVRINLRPFLRMGGNTDALFEAFIRTGKSHKGTEIELCSVWEKVKGLQTLYKQADMDLYYSLQIESGFPAVHHSGIYRKLYLPAYRVISVKELSCLEN